MAAMSDLDSLEKELVRLRHQLHTRPELAGHEAGTAAFVARALAAYGPAEILTGLGGHGLAAVFPAAGGVPGPTVMLRCELDALALEESPDCPWPSKTPGTAHRCGHDGHMAILLGVARRLAASPPPRGQVILLFQPAEETGTGAAALLADSRFRTLDPDWIFALHNLPGHPLWSVLCREGAFAAGQCGMRVRLRGQAGLEQALAGLVAGLIGLNSDRGEDLALVTIPHTRLESPAAGCAEILATIRAEKDTVLRRLKKEAARRVQAAGLAGDLEVELGFQEELPVTLNDARAVTMVTAAARELDLEIQSPEESPFRWSEDFGLLSGWRPGAMFGLGAGEDHPPLHAAGYDFADGLLIPGVLMMEKILTRALQSHRPA